MSNSNQIPQENYRKAIFLKELPRRFRCVISFSGEEKYCYVPSSCKLEPLVSLKNKSVLVIKNSESSQLEYSLVAVKFKHNYILLNSGWANTLVLDSIKRRMFSYVGKRNLIQSEVTIDNYRCDFYIQNTRTIIEVKSIITDKPTALFPTMESNRFIRQLTTIKAELLKDKNAHLVIVGMNPYLQEITLNHKLQCYQLLKECMELGMTVHAFKVRLSDGEFKIHSEIRIQF